MSENQAPTQAANWKIILAALLDFFTVFAVGGYLIGKLTGQSTENGFDLSGGPSLLLFAVIIVYFVAGNRYLRGTLWKHILGPAQVSLAKAALNAARGLSRCGETLALSPPIR